MAQTALIQLLTLDDMFRTLATFESSRILSATLNGGTIEAVILTLSTASFVARFILEGNDAPLAEEKNCSEENEDEKCGSNDFARQLLLVISSRTSSPMLLGCCEFSFLTRVMGCRCCDGDGDGYIITNKKINPKEEIFPSARSNKQGKLYKSVHYPHDN
jgi:hypothetical protein